MCVAACAVLLLAAGALVASPALAASAGNTQSCRPTFVETSTSPEDVESLPAELTSPLEAGVLAQFAVLRRAALPSDRIPALSSVGFQVDSQLASYYPAYVREVKTLADGTRYFLIPGFERAQSVPPAHCLSASQQVQRQKLVEQERQRAAEPVYCIVELGREASGTECEPFAEVAQSVRFFQPDLTEEAIVELAPDGVASVRASYVSGAPVTVAVAENVYALGPRRAILQRGLKALKKLQHRIAGIKHLTTAQRRRELNRLLTRIGKVLVEAEPTKIEWLDGTGGLVRTIGRPSGRAGGLIELSTTVRAG